MKFSKETIRFADHLIHHYAKFDEIDNAFYFLLDDAPDFDLDEMAAFILSDNNDLASEAVGYDNPWFERIMLPAFLNHLRNSTDSDKEMEFAEKWKYGIRQYLKETIENLLQERLENYNSDEGFVRERSSYKGVNYKGTDLWGI